MDKVLFEWHKTWFFIYFGYSDLADTDYKHCAFGYMCVKQFTNDK